MEIYRYISAYCQLMVTGANGQNGSNVMSRVVVEDRIESGNV